MLFLEMNASVYRLDPVVRALPPPMSATNSLRTVTPFCESLEHSGNQSRVKSNAGGSRASMTKRTSSVYLPIRVVVETGGSSMSQVQPHVCLTEH